MNFTRQSKSLLITANQALDQWDVIFPNQMIAVAAIDRLVHHAVIIKIDELSYRKASSSANNEAKKVVKPTLINPIQKNWNFNIDNDNDSQIAYFVKLVPFSILANLSFLIKIFYPHVLVWSLQAN